MATDDTGNRAGICGVDDAVRAFVKKIFAPAPTHIPTKDKTGEPSFRTKADKQVLISIGTEKAQ